MSNHSTKYNVLQTRRGHVVMSPDAELIGGGLERDEAILIAKTLNGEGSISALSDWLTTPRGAQSGRGVQRHLDQMSAA